jgi:hypothetical protein
MSLLNLLIRSYNKATITDPPVKTDAPSTPLKIYTGKCIPKTQKSTNVKYKQSVPLIKISFLKCYFLGGDFLTRKIKTLRVNKIMEFIHQLSEY